MARNKKQQQIVLAAMLEEARRRTEQGLDMRGVVQHVRQVRDDAKSAAHLGLTIIPACEPEKGHSMTKDQEQQKAQASTGSAEQRAVLYGPEGRADYSQGDTITFASADTGGRELTGEILYVRAPGEAIRGGRVHPTVYITFVQGEAFPRMVYPGDIVER